MLKKIITPQAEHTMNLKKRLKACDVIKLLYLLLIRMYIFEKYCVQHKDNGVLCIQFIEHTNEQAKVRHKLKLKNI